MLKPMPSPHGTNHARRFIAERGARGAYDAAPGLSDSDLSDEAALRLLEFLRGKLSDDDLATFCKIAGIDGGMTMDDDQPEPFEGRPQRGGFGQDSMNAQLRRIRQMAGRIKVRG